MTVTEVAPSPSPCTSKSIFSSSLAGCHFFLLFSSSSFCSCITLSTLICFDSGRGCVSGRGPSLVTRIDRATGFSPCRCFKQMETWWCSGNSVAPSIAFAFSILEIFVSVFVCLCLCLSVFVSLHLLSLRDCSFVYITSWHLQYISVSLHLLSLRDCSFVYITPWHPQYISVSLHLHSLRDCSLFFTPFDFPFHAQSVMHTHHDTGSQTQPFSSWDGSSENCVGGKPQSIILPWWYSRRKSR